MIFNRYLYNLENWWEKNSLGFELASSKTKSYVKQFRKMSYFTFIKIIFAKLFFQ